MLMKKLLYMFIDDVNINEFMQLVMKVFLQSSY